MLQYSEFPLARIIYCHCHTGPRDPLALVSVQENILEKNLKTKTKIYRVLQSVTLRHIPNTKLFHTKPDSRVMGGEGGALYDVLP